MSLVPGYIALSRLPNVTSSLDDRTALLAARLAAELSGCCWCIERTRHDCRRAGLASEPLSSDRDRVALALVRAIARAGSDARVLDESVLHQAERFFKASELAALIRIAADHHCLESSTLARES